MCVVRLITVVLCVYVRAAFDSRTVYEHSFLTVTTPVPMSQSLACLVHSQQGTSTREFIFCIIFLKL